MRFGREQAITRVSVVFEAHSITEHKMGDAEVSLRPLVAKATGGANPFAGFGKGLGQGIKSKLVVRGAFA